MEQMTLDFKIKEMGKRIRELREIEGLTEQQMADKTGVELSEYVACENGESDLNFAFIYRCANVFGVNVTDIIEGYSPMLSAYTLTRKGEGQEIANAHGMTYYNLAYAFQNKIAEPLYVKSVFDPEAQGKPV
ncbi:MAG: helix-turn-helix transcriptional regulator, partial [Clostridia bacterium]|nr:helix-turn-helix transcriptional regulator [Clostridia bacterium]